MIELRRCQDLENQRQKKSVNLEGCLQALIRLYLEKKDPLKKAQRQKARGKLKEKNDTQASVADRTAWDEKPEVSVSDPFKDSLAPFKNEKRPKSPPKSFKRSAIPAKTKHQVMLRDGGRCSYHNPRGDRCSSQRYLEIHHRAPVSQGGRHALDNLELLCSGHHRVRHLSGFWGG